MSLHDIPTAMGALFIGAFFATMLSGVVLLQSLLYFTTYRSDRIAVKLLVLGVWGLGPSHASIWDAMWDYLIVDCGDTSSVDHIPWSVPLTFIPRAIVTFFVHNFFAHPIYLLSNKNWLMASPVVILAIVRLVSASVSTWEMLHYHSYELFKMRMPMYTTLPRWSVCHLTLHFQWIFTPGLFVSSLVDIVITGLLLYLFQSSRLDSGHSINHVLDKLILYAFETGSLTWCVAFSQPFLCDTSKPPRHDCLDDLHSVGRHGRQSHFFKSALRHRNTGVPLCGPQSWHSPLLSLRELAPRNVPHALNTRQAIRQARSSSSGQRGPVLFLESCPKNASAPQYLAESGKVPTARTLYPGSRAASLIRQHLRSPRSTSRRAYSTTSTRKGPRDRVTEQRRWVDIIGRLRCTFRKRHTGVTCTY